MTQDVKDRTAAVGDWFPPGFVEAVGHTLVLFRALVGLGVLILGVLVWIGAEVTSIANSISVVTTLVARR